MTPPILAGFFIRGVLPRFSSTRDPDLAGLESQLWLYLSREARDQSRNPSHEHQGAQASEPFMIRKLSESSLDSGPGQSRPSGSDR